MYVPTPSNNGIVRATALGITANDKIIETKMVSDIDIYFCS